MSHSRNEARRKDAQDRRRRNEASRALEFDLIVSHYRARRSAFVPIPSRPYVVHNGRTHLQPLRPMDRPKVEG